MKIKDIVSIIFFSLFLNAPLALAQNAAILPQGKTQFLDNNANPLSAGKVYFYIPSTTTFKTTWQDAGKTIPNTNPVTLDAGGRAIIYGDGTYRQRVFDRNANLIFDAVTASAGTGGGTTGTGDGDLVGTVKPWAGLVAPNQYVFAYGQEISRATYPAFLTAITLNQNISCTSASPTLTGLSDTSQIPVGAVLEATCIAAGSIVLSKTTTTVTMNNNASLTTATTGVFFFYGNGNGSTTFNVPDLRGQVIAGRTNMGGVASTNLTDTFFSNPFGQSPQATGAKGGLQFSQLAASSLPPYTPSGTVTAVSATGTVSTPTITITGGTHGGTGAGVVTLGGGTTIPINDALVTATSSTPIFTGTGGTATFTGAAQGGINQPFPLVQPTMTLNYIIKITPDQNSASASGVTSLGLMTGDIACGTGLLCTGNIISSTGGSAANVNWLPSGTGGISQTVQDSLQERGVSPINYGAISNSNAAGVAATNATAFANAFAASPSVFCDPGQTFYVTGITLPTTAKHFYGACTINLTDNSSNAINATATTDLVIEDMTINVDISLTTSNGVLVNNAIGTIVQNVTVNGAHFGIFTYNGSDKTSILNNKVFGPYGIAVYTSAFSTSNNPPVSLTIDNGAAAFVHWNAHGLVAGNTVIFYTTSTLPAPLITGETYYVIASGLTANQFRVATTQGGSAINTTTAGSGTFYASGNSPSNILISGNVVTPTTRGVGTEQGISLTSATKYRVIANEVNVASGSFSIESSLGSYGFISSNTVQNSGAEAAHTDSGVNVIISNNVLKFNANSTDYGISVSADNGPPARNTNVIGNVIDSSGAPGIVFVGVEGCFASGNYLKNVNAALTTQPGAIMIDGTTPSGTAHCSIGSNTIYDPNGNVQYQVYEGKFSNPGSIQPDNNTIAQQFGDVGTVGYVSKSGPATSTITRTPSSSSSADTTTGYYFDGISFAKRDTASSDVYLYDFNGNLSGALGSNASQATRWGNTTHRWLSRGFGTTFATLTAIGWNWNNIAAPSTPAAGTLQVWADSTDLIAKFKNSAGNTSVSIFPQVCTTGSFISSIPTTGAPVCSTYSVANLTGLGTGVATALGVNVGTAGSFVVNGGALGSPSSVGTIPAFTLGGTIAGGGNQLNNIIIGTSTPLAGAFTTLSATNQITSTLATGTAPLVVASTTQVANLNAATAGTATNTAITNDTTTNATMFPTWVTANTGNLPQKVSSTKLTFNPSSGVFTLPVLNSTGASNTFAGTITFSAQSNVGVGPGFSYSTSGAGTFLLAGGPDGYTFNNNAGTTNIMLLSNTGALSSLLSITAGTYLKNAVTTVGGLPTCNAGLEGGRYGVTDATVVSAVFGTILVGGSTVHTSAYCNGTNWIGG